MHPANSLPAAASERWTADSERLTANGGRRSTVVLARGLVGLLVVAMAVLSVRSSPRVAEFLWLPESIAEWTNRYGVLRNTPAFGFLALVVGVIGQTRPRRVLGYLGVAAFALLCEVAQLWVPTRFCDVRDVAAAWAGVALAAAVVALTLAVSGRR